MENNKITFTGIIYPRHMFSDDAIKIEKFIKENKTLIDRFEKQYEVDVRIKDDINSIDFQHRQYGNLEGYGAKGMLMSELPKKVELIFTDIANAIENAKNRMTRIKQKKDRI